MHACQGAPIPAGLPRAADLQGGGVVEPPAAAALIAEGGHGKGLHAGQLHEAAAAQVPCAPARTCRAAFDCLLMGKQAVSTCALWLRLLELPHA